MLLVIITYSTAQTIEIEKQYVNSIIKSPGSDEFVRKDIAKQWTKFSTEYVYPVLPVDSTKGELQFSEVIEIENVNKKVIFERCEQWLVLSYFQMIYSNAEVGKIIATASADIPHQYETFSFGSKSNNPTTTKTDYTITLTIKDNKLKYELSDIRYYVQLVESEYSLPISNLFPIVSKSRNDWFKNLTYLERLDKILMSDVQQSLIKYIAYHKQDYEF